MVLVSCLSMGKVVRFFCVVLFLFAFKIAWAAEPVRVMVFTAPFGSGHNTAANRIKDVIATHYQNQGMQAEIIVKNTLEFTPKWWTDIAMKHFTSFQSNAPILYSAAFENYLKKAYKVDNAGEMGLFKQLMVKTDQMDAFLTDTFKNSEGQLVPPDVIFSTWPGSTEALIYLRNKKGSRYSQLSKTVPLAHVQTDNAAHDRYFHLFAQSKSGDRGADVVYVPSREVYDEYRRLGFSNVVFTGMPLRLKSPQLPTPEEREKEKQAARVALDLPPNIKTVMIEAGKNGATNYAVIVASLVRYANGAPLNIIAACGENEGYVEKLKLFAQGAKRRSSEFKMLYKEMKELYKPRNVKKFLKLGKNTFSLNPTMTEAEVTEVIERGLPTNVTLVARGYGPLDPLRAASDIVITKPGGLSTAELGADGRPMIILQEYASGEALPNGPLFEKKNLAVINQDIAIVGEQTIQLLSDETKLALMYNSSNEFRKQFELEKVLPFVEQARLAHEAVRSSPQSQNALETSKMKDGSAIMCRNVIDR